MFYGRKTSEESQALWQMRLANCCQGACVKIIIEVDPIETQEGSLLFRLHNGLGMPEVRFAAETVEFVKPGHAENHEVYHQAAPVKP